MSYGPPVIPHESPLSGESAEAPFPEPRWRAWLAWAVIWICVFGVMYRISRMYSAATEKGLSNPSAELQVQFVGKAAVGIKALLPPVPATQGATTQGNTSRTATSRPTPPNADQLIASMDQYAKAPPEKVRTIIVVGELLGPEKALKRIDDLDATKPLEPIQQDLQSLRTIYNDGVDSIDAEAKQRLIDRHGFFGRLATVYNISDNEEHRAKILADAKTSAIVLTVLGVLMFILLGVIVVAVITAIVLAALGVFKRIYRPQRSVNSAFVEAFAIYIVLFLGINQLMGLMKLNALAWDWLLLLLIPAVMKYVRWRGNDRDTVHRGFGWHWGRGPLVEIPCGIFGYFAGVPLVALGFFITFQLMKYSGATPMHPIQKLLQGDWKQTLNLYGIACVFAPVIEETMFRGALFHHMRRRWNWVSSASVVAFIFAAVHPQGWTLIPTLGAIAIVLAALREWRGSLWASIAAHATNNFIVLSFGLLAAR